MSRIITQNNQTLLDVAVQESGTVEALFDLMKLNGLTALPIAAQSELILSPVLRPEIVEYYKSRTKQMGLAPVEVISGMFVPQANQAIKYMLRHDFVSGSPTSYCGKAVLGSTESGNVWDISKIVVSEDGTTTVTTAQSVAWTDRYTVTYS